MEEKLLSESLLYGRTSTEDQDAYDPIAVGLRSHRDGLVTRRIQTFPYSWCLCIVLLLSLTLNLLLLFWLHPWLPPESQCPGEWDPILGEPSALRTVRFNGTFDRSSPFKGPPSPSVDSAWESILPLGAMRISEKMFQKLNASRGSVSLPAEVGGGRMALFEAIHQVHCVHALWTATYPAYYTNQLNYSLEHPIAWREHMDHCADMLRQKLMCDADPALITFNWLNDRLAPHPNFNVQHKCRNYSRLLELAESYRVADELLPSKLEMAGKDLLEYEDPPFDPAA